MSLSAPCTTRSRIAGIERTRTLPPSFGISCRRAGNGAYVRLTSSSLICTRNASTPCASMAAKVTPSTPGAPSFFLASAYASLSVSILQTWTYKPQNRQDVSAFALTYSLRLRSCKSMDAFVISSLPSLHWRHCKWQGPFAPRTLLRFLTTPDPAATLSSSADFPVSPVIRPTLLWRFRAGTRRASPVAQHVLVTVPSLPTPL